MEKGGALPERHPSSSTTSAGSRRQARWLSAPRPPAGSGRTYEYCPFRVPPPAEPVPRGLWRTSARPHAGHSMVSRGAQKRPSWFDSEFPRDDSEETSTFGIRRIAGCGPNSSSWSSDRRIPRRLAKDKGLRSALPPLESFTGPLHPEVAPRVSEIRAIAGRSETASTRTRARATDPSTRSVGVAAHRR